ncbi:MAG: YkgJ family cysteine cluster protein [Patescibacteria group bacterium]|jgi:Fe-S-cluster containining protein
MIEILEKADHQKAKEISDQIEKTIRDFRTSFQCQKCGKCCEEGVGVALWAHEFQALKKLDKHIYKHITTIGNWYALKLPCHFYNKRKHKCSIYDKRPIACRMYPLGIRPDASTKISEQCPATKLMTKEV